MIDLRDENVKSTINNGKYGNLNIPSKLKVNNSLNNKVMYIINSRIMWLLHHINIT